MFLLIQLCLDFFGHIGEKVIDVLSGLGAGLEESHCQRLGQLLPLLFRHLSFLAEVCLVANQHFRNVFRGMHFDLFDPVLYILKCLPFVDGVGEYYSHGAPVVGLSDGLKFLLAGSVPDLQAYSMFAHENGFDFEVDADSGEMRSHKVVIAVLKEHISFPDTAVPNHQQFDVVIIVLILMHVRL